MALTRILCLPAVSCEGCGDALVAFADCAQCRRRSRLRKRMRLAHFRRAARDRALAQARDNGRFVKASA